MNQRLIRLLDFLHPFLDQLKDPYWFIGSASLYLQTVVTSFNDIDLLTSKSDARWLREKLDKWRLIDTIKEDGDKYRSEFSQFFIADMNFEVMGNLEVRNENEWVKVIDVIHETDRLVFDKYTLPVPSLSDQLTIYKLLARSKDEDKVKKIYDRIVSNQ